MEQWAIYSIVNNAVVWNRKVLVMDTVENFGLQNKKNLFSLQDFKMKSEQSDEHWIVGPKSCTAKDLHHTMHQLYNIVRLKIYSVKDVTIPKNSYLVGKAKMLAKSRVLQNKRQIPYQIFGT